MDTKITYYQSLHVWNSFFSVGNTICGLLLHLIRKFILPIPVKTTTLLYFRFWTLQ